MSIKKQTLLFSALACLLLLGTSACGVKPSSVEPPSNAQDTAFPRTYPDPSTDP